MKEQEFSSGYTCLNVAARERTQERAGVLLRIHLFKCDSWAENAGKSRTGGIGAQEQKTRAKGGS